MGAGSYEQVGSADAMKYMDPTGRDTQSYGAVADQAQNAANQMSAYQASGNMDPEAYMRMTLGQMPGLANQVSGQNSQLTQGLNAIAQRQSALGGEAALAAMGGGRNSGAAQAAFGRAYADPFANAQAQLQQNQLQGTLGLWNNAMGLNANQLNNQQQALMAREQAMRGMQQGQAQNATAWYTPQYEYQKGGWDYAKDTIGMAGDLVGIGTGVASLFGGGGGGAPAGNPGGARSAAPSGGDGMYGMRGDQRPIWGNDDPWNRKY